LLLLALDAQDSVDRVVAALQTGRPAPKGRLLLLVVVLLLLLLVLQVLHARHQLLAVLLRLVLDQVRAQTRVARRMLLLQVGLLVRLQLARLLLLLRARSARRVGRAARERTKRVLNERGVASGVRVRVGVAVRVRRREVLVRQLLLLLLLVGCGRGGRLLCVAGRRRCLQVR